MKTIKKVKLRQGMFLEVDWTERTADDFLEQSTKSNNAVHNDFINALKGLTVHLRELSEQPENANMEVIGYSIGGSGESEGVTISGSRTLSSGKKLNLNSPFEKYEDSDYGAISELINQLQVIEAEVHAYLFEGKHAPKAQLEMEFEETEE